MKNSISQMTEQEIVAEALEMGFTVEEVTNQRGQAGYRVNGSKMTWQSSPWLTLANNRLYELQNAK